MSRFVLLTLVWALAFHVQAQSADELVPPRKFVDAGSWVCAIDSQQDVRCWLRVERGHWPTPTIKSQPRAFQKVPGITSAVALDGNEDYVCALDREGAVHCWGSVWTSERQRLWPKQIALAGPARQLAVDGGAGCALLASGQVQCWGVARCLPAMRSRQIELSEDPETIPFPADLVQISSGNGAFCGLDRHGTVTCWGDICRDYGGPQCTPTPIKLQHVRAIASSCAVVGKDRELHCFTGRDGWQTPDWVVVPNESCKPTRVRNIQHVKQLAVGASSGIVLTDEGHVYHWGDSHAGGIDDIGLNVQAAPTISLDHAVKRGAASFEDEPPEVTIGPLRRVDHTPRFALAPRRVPHVPGVKGVIASGHYNCLVLERDGPLCEFVLGRVPFSLHDVWPSVRFDPGRAGSPSISRGEE